MALQYGSLFLPSFLSLKFISLGFLEISERSLLIENIMGKKPLWKNIHLRPLINWLDSQGKNTSQTSLPGALIRVSG
jgi:hypothetical protein